LCFLVVVGSSPIKLVEQLKKDPFGPQGEGKFTPQGINFTAQVQALLNFYVDGLPHLYRP